MTITEASIDDANAEALLGASEATAGTPAAGAFTWRADSESVNGYHAQATIPELCVGERTS